MDLEFIYFAATIGGEQGSECDGTNIGHTLSLTGFGKQIPALLG